ncbi:carbohydrate-binding module family 1 protein [Crepidotus variabilis]|uniref:Carbohydrate-binding module family 1 protein n=1 Tax=Crepidotus variabilis TaxID=179855 RepID=A0A9P6JI42_9AGAR|nr:carbohydrate-binding module family 1 protein [Crepidotus variabilis]
MVRSIYLSTIALSAVGSVYAQSTAPQYGQCGGQGWSGATTCPSGWTCTASGQWYSQCLPGGSGTTAPPATNPGSPTSTAIGALPTLQTGWNFIRAVVDPNFHKYLQSEVTGTPSDAVLADRTTAAQFQITNGQLIQSVSGGNLYATVEPKTASATKLKVSWSKTPDTLGTFVFSGDTVTWSSTTVTRPQNNFYYTAPGFS